VAQVLLHWRESTGRLTRTDPRYSRAAFARLRTDYLARDPRLHSGRPLAICGAGRRTRQRAQLLLDHGFRPVAWIDIDPRKIGNSVHGVPVHAPQWLDRADKPFVLSYVTNHGARDIIAAQLQAMGYLRGRDYLMVG
jgi:FlaA1/EpsC-like NDP-sugar epimerase